MNAMSMKMNGGRVLSRRGAADDTPFHCVQLGRCGDACQPEQTTTHGNTQHMHTCTETPRSRWECALLHLHYCCVRAIEADGGPPPPINPGRFDYNGLARSVLRAMVRSEYQRPAPTKPPNWLPLVAVATWPREPWLRYDSIEAFLRDVYITHTGRSDAATRRQVTRAVCGLPLPDTDFLWTPSSDDRLAPTFIAALPDDARVLLRRLKGALTARGWAALRRTLHRWTGCLLHNVSR